jgi:UDP-glucose 4-epimerase
MNVLITGGAGFIGSNLAKFLVGKGYKVRIIDNLSTGKLENIKEFSENLDFLEGDITDLKTFKRALEDMDFLIHLAAITSVQRSMEEPGLTYKVNFEGTKIALELSEKFRIKRFIFASSCAIYGNPEKLPVSEDFEPSPLSPYAETKLYGEKMCLEYLKKGLDVIILRFFNVFGPKQDADSPYSGVISRFIKRILEGKSPIIYGDGEQTRDFIFVNDVTSLIEKALLKSLSDIRIFNIGSGKRYSVKRVFEILKEISGFKGDPEFEEGRKGEVRHTQADIRRAEKEFEWKPEISIEEGLKITYKYMKKEA